ncbi:glycosyltransferase family 61 protein [Rhizobium sp. DKSPLA3]|uniref:Glycosyltransferase family 61 protein n=1 Tax=Rhizobium quercicola TaxID=2901226 RepID=A0A9X1NNV4_9HYPH|nr:glycosyltransferase family 61 protein [Rhizobium quercicola]
MIESPAFLAPPPVVSGLDLIPASIHDAMRPGWYSNYHGARSISIDKVFDVHVTAEGLVFNSDGKVISQTITQHAPEEQERALRDIASASDIPVIDTSCLLLRKRGEANYGHWMVEILPKLELARKLTHVSGVTIPDVGSGMNKVISDSLGIVDTIKSTPRFPLKANSVTFFKELIVVSGMTLHGSYMSPLVFEALDRIRDAVEGEAPRKIFVSRAGAPRNIGNEADLHRLVADHGFDILHPGKLDLKEQVRKFKNASCVMGVMGAGMTNIMFAPSTARIINLAPATMPDTFFYFIATLKGQSYEEVRGENVNGGPSWDEAFLVDSGNLTNLLGADSKA